MDSKALLRTLTINYGDILVPYIEAYLTAGKFPKEWQITIANTKPDDGFFHPSSDAFATPRSLYLKKKKMDERIRPSAALTKTFACGHMWHGYIENIIEDMGLVQHSNIERYVTTILDGPYGPFTGAGTGDLVGVQIPNKGEWLVDIKTMKKDEFEAGAHAMTYKKWVAQVSCYMDWFELDQAMVLAVCKDSPHQFREYHILKDQNVLDEIYDRWSYTWMCLATNQMPEDKYIPEDPLLLNPGDSVLDILEVK